MHKILFILFFVISLTYSSLSSELIDYMRNRTVIVDSEESQGTGVLISRGTNSYILSAAHVASHNIKITKNFEKGGLLNERIKCEPLNIIKYTFKDGQVTEKTQVKGDIIKYSSFDTGYDLTLIKIRNPNYSTNSIVFCFDNHFDVGDTTWNCSNFKGEIGAYSISRGMLSFKNRELLKHRYNQVDNTIHSGSSGSGVFLDNKEFIGILTMKLENGFNLVVRMEEIQEFCREFDVEGILYPDCEINEKVEAR
jgi:S1-C subfamily serine protease